MTEDGDVTETETQQDSDSCHDDKFSSDVGQCDGESDNSVAGSTSVPPESQLDVKDNDEGSSPEKSSNDKSKQIAELGRADLQVIPKNVQL